MQLSSEHIGLHADGIQSIALDTIRSAREHSKAISELVFTDQTHITIQFAGRGFIFSCTNKDEMLGNLNYYIKMLIIRDFFSIYELGELEKIAISINGKLRTIDQSNQSQLFKCIFKTSPNYSSQAYDEERRARAVMEFLREYTFADGESLNIHLLGMQININKESNTQLTLAAIESQLEILSRVHREPIVEEQVEEEKVDSKSRSNSAALPSNKQGNKPSGNPSFNLKILGLKLFLALLVLACTALIIALTADVSSVPVLGLIASKLTHTAKIATTVAAGVVAGSSILVMLNPKIKTNCFTLFPCYNKSNDSGDGVKDSRFTPTGNR